jgi:hypothetical protein
MADEPRKKDGEFESGKDDKKETDQPREEKREEKREPEHRGHE